jgi:hypothetical protein
VLALQAARLHTGKLCWACPAAAHFPQIDIFNGTCFPVMQLQNV